MVELKTDPVLSAINCRQSNVSTGIVPFLLRVRSSDARKWNDVHPVRSVSTVPQLRARGAFARMARLVAAVLVLVLLPTAAGTFHGTAHALPDDPVAPPGVTLLWPALGLKPGIVLDPKLSPVFTVPVPAGLAAVRLLGMIHTPVNIRAGYIEVDDGDGKFLAAVDLPSAAPGQVVVPFDVDISTARFSNSAIDLRFTVRPIDNGDEFCGPMQQVVLSDLATVFTGIEMPATTIASFFPPILQQVTIYTPTDAEAVE